MYTYEDYTLLEDIIYCEIVNVSYRSEGQLLQRQLSLKIWRALFDSLEDKDNIHKKIYEVITSEYQIAHIFYVNYADLPLYINNDLMLVKTIAKWRLKIGK